MRIFPVASVFAAALVLGACGQTTEQQAATGAGAGLLMGGVPGAVVGGTVGAVAGDEIQETAQQATP